MDMIVNATFLRNIKDYGISADLMGTVIFTMICLDKGRYELLDALDDDNREKRMIILYRMLSRKGFIDPTEDDSDVHYKLTDKGYDFLNYVYAELGNSDNPINEVKEVNSILTTIKSGGCEDWIAEYVNMFPTGIIEGKRLRTSTAECIPKMKSFMTKYGYDKDTILEATRLYLHDEEGGQKLTRNSKYFIEKHDREKGYISDLLTYCERVIEEAANPQEKINMDVI